MVDALWAQYFLNSNSDIVQLECLEISHPNFSQTYYIVRNARRGVTVKHEDGLFYDYTYYPLQIETPAAKENLDVKLTITMGDLGEIIPTELDNVRAANAFAVKPIVRYRTYRSDDLTTILYGPLKLEVVTFSNKREGSTMAAQAPRLNINKTGENYTIDRFPSLKGFL